MSDYIKRSDAIRVASKECHEFRGIFGRIEEGIKELPSADRPQGEWIEKPHKVYLPRDYEPDITDYHDRQYNEEDHSIIQHWWHCNQCDYEADRWTKPTFNYCPNCGARMNGEEHDLEHTD